MIKRVRELTPEALIGDESFRNYIENFESEVLRGIGTLCILNVIREHKEKGIYGYQLLKELSEKTNNILIIDEGALYPMLKKLENWGPSGKKIQVVTSERKKIDGRMRKYYTLTPEGYKVYNFMEGFFSKLIESLGNLLSFNVELEKKGYFYCPNCANKIDIKEDGINFCEICGMNFTGRFPGIEKKDTAETSENNTFLQSNESNGGEINE